MRKIYMLYIVILESNTRNTSTFYPNTWRAGFRRTKVDLYSLDEE